MREPLAVTCRSSWFERAAEQGVPPDRPKSGPPGELYVGPSWKTSCLSPKCTQC